MRRRILGVIGVAATAVIAATTLHAQTAFRARVGLRGFRDPIALDTLAADHQVNAPTGKTFSAAASVLKTLGLPVELRDSVGGLIGNTEFTKSRTLVGQQMSTWLNCGSSMTGPNADNDRITIALVIIIDPAPNNTTRMRIGLVGSGSNIAGNSTEPVACGSTGRLEEKMAQMIKNITG
jgi:hypothetical protein